MLPQRHFHHKMCSSSISWYHVRQVNSIQIWWIYDMLSENYHSCYRIMLKCLQKTSSIILNMTFSSMWCEWTWTYIHFLSFSFFFVGGSSVDIFVQKKKCGVHYIIIIIMKHIFLIKNKNRWCITAHTTIVLWNEMEMRNVFVDGKKIFFSFPLLKHL